MKNKFITFYSIIVSLIFIGVLGYFGFNIYYENSIGKLNANIISYYAKISFIIILIFTIITFLIILFAKPEKNRKSQTVVFTHKDADSEKVTEEEVYEAAQITETKTSEEKADDSAADKHYTEKTIPFPADELTPEPLPEQENNGDSMYSEDTGFCTEQFFKTRLENELIRSSSSEYDMVLFLIKITLDRKSEQMKEICQLILEYFQFQNMVFEYKDDCFAAIKSNITLDEAVPMADELHDKISALLENTDAACNIGMSSRTIRLISSDRILKEAAAALEHAQEEEDSPVIAFRANAEKYMKYIND